jgi:5-methyltetrahydropteroyltriglutamate--homocysteine methyltransferase
MKTAVTGFPRIGKARELKFAVEKYFAGMQNMAELEKTAGEIRAYGWNRQREVGIGFIPSNDFSFYDNMLDTALMLGAVPERYASLGLSKTDTYFAMARGYQGSGGDVKALAMKKWFNTNYHYLVPELAAGMNLRCDSEHSKPVHEYREAKTLGIETVPVLIGPYTFLQLARYTGKTTRNDFTAAAADAYSSLITTLASSGAAWIQLAEPALVLDMTSDDCVFLDSLYKTLLTRVRRTSGVRLLVQTCFGDVRDCWNTICGLGFDGIGIDFIEGKANTELLRQSFPQETYLFAGIVSGKNIWRTDYVKAVELVNELSRTVPDDHIVLATSCPLLHVPYTTASENKIGHDLLWHFAFAEEKLGELEDIKEVLENTDTGRAALADNKKLFSKPRTAPDVKVCSALSRLTADDLERKPAFAERAQIQKKEFGLPLLPATTIGSFPQTKEVRAVRASFKKGHIGRDQYIKFNQEKIAACIALQEKLGLDVLVHGEFERNDMVEYFGDHLDGYVFTENGWVQSYGTRCVKPPVIWSDVSRREPITIPWSVYAQSCTKKPVKGMLTGPVTILNWSFPRDDISLKEQAFQLALAIRAEVLDLEKNGIRIIQIDEAALREKLPLRKADRHTDYLDWAIPAFRLVHSGVKPETQIHTHMCYSEFGDIIADIDAMDADVITFEASRSDLTILDALTKAHFRTAVGPGVYDIHSPRIPSVEEIAGALRKMLQKIPAEKLWVNPDCGLKTRGEEETIVSLAHLTAAAEQIRRELQNSNRAAASGMVTSTRG